SVADARPALLALLLRRDGDSLVLVVGEDRLHDVRRSDLAATHGGQHILDVLARQPVQHRFQALLRKTLAAALESALEDAGAEPGILLADGVLGGAADGR